MTPNPRVEGVMVSAPPQIAYYYKHEVAIDSPEALIMKVLKDPIDRI
jgi:coproporphyrinogen III oxidase